jgi:hypothetical protein
MADITLPNFRIEAGADPTVDISPLTTQSLSGNGVFDVLMSTVKLHLKEELDKGRIVGTDYANVYLGSLQYAMQQAVVYLNNLKNEELIEANIGLTRQKIATEIAQIADTVPTGISFTDGSITGLLANQRDKIEAETNLLNQKTKTEQAQTLDSVDGSSIAGMLGQQIALYEAQTNGFTRDAEQKLLKAMLDTWSVRMTMGEAQADTTNNLDDTSIGAVVTKAKAGIGVT